MGNAYLNPGCYHMPQLDGKSRINLTLKFTILFWVSSCNTVNPLILSINFPSNQKKMRVDSFF